MKLLKLLLIGLMVVSCNPRGEDPLEEDYSQLFPFRGIDTPDIYYEDMIARNCNPDEALEQYKYPGVTLPSEREYTVTLKCKYTAIGNDYATRYAIRYIAEDKSIKVIGTDAAMANVSEVLENGEQKTISFKVKSGYPLYLSVNGVGARNSSIYASISAVSTDGYIISPELFTEQYQNKEGPNRIENPYCKYIILP